jgi:plasmid stabilization system protein ParE
MAERIVAWTHTARDQRRAILRYWTKQNGSTVYAEKLIQLIAERTKTIALQPESFRLSDFKNVRVSSLGHFSIFYKYSFEQVIIMAFWDNRQNPQDLLDYLHNLKE